MGKKLALAIAVLPFFGAAFAAENCNPDKFLGTCETFSRLGEDVNGAKELSLPRYGDGCVIYNSIGRPSRGPVPLVTPAKAEQALKIAKNALDAAKEIVRDGRPVDGLSPEQRAMQARLSEVKIRVGKRGEEGCESPRDPNAFYDDDSHELVLCPASVMLAPAALKMIVAHELGHVISPCSMRKAFYEVLVSRAALSPAIEKCFSPMSKKDGETLSSIGLDQKFFVFPDERDLKEPYKTVIAKLKACQIVKVPEGLGGVEKPGRFGEVAACLEKKYEPLFAAYRRTQTRKKDKKRDPAFSEANGSISCLRTLDEHFADAFGAKVFGRMLESTSMSKNEMARVGLVQIVSMACGEGPTPENRFEYPGGVDRAWVHMSDPATQQALGCVIPAAKLPCTIDHPQAVAAPAPAAAPAPNQR